jgi:hypothetical protein
MYFPIPIPFSSEYPVILKWCEPFTVSVTDVEGGRRKGDEDEEEQGEAGLELRLSLRTFPIL